MKRAAFLPLLAIFAATFPACLAAAASDLPSFQAGYWSFKSTVTMPGANKPQVRMVNRCTDPGEDIRKKWEMLAGKACRFSPIEHAGNRYTYSSTCDRQGVSLWLKSVIIVESNAAYRAETESHTNKQASRETIEAHRVGACPIVGPNAQKHTDASPPLRHDPATLRH